jgi:hypothetical protein
VRIGIQNTDSGFPVVPTIPVVPAIPVVPGSFWLFANKLIEKEEVHQTKLPFVKELDNFFSFSERKQKYLLKEEKNKLNVKKTKDVERRVVEPPD